MKKSGFTMIELIFVIVILGVLAAVAIPKLNATRDDAEQAKAMTNLATLMGDLTSYYTAQGSFDTNVSAMSNVPLKELTADAAQKADTYGAATEFGDKKVYSYEIKNKPCIAFQVDGADLNVVSAASGKADTVCKNIFANPSTQNILSHTHTCAGKLEAASVSDWTTYASGESDATIIRACEAEADAYTKAHAKPSASDEKVTISTKVKIDKEGQKITLNFEGAGVKF